MSESAAPSARDARMRRTASLTALILVILASLGVVVSLVGGWVRTTLFDTDAFMDVIEPSLASEEVVTVLGDAISGQAVAALDLEGRLETRLTAIDTYLAEGLVDALDLSPAARRLLGRADLPRLANLAPSIAEPIEQSIEESIHDFVTSAGFQATLPEAVAFAHRGAVALIKEETDDLENVSIVGGEVRWNVLPAVHNAIAHVFDEGILDAVVDSLDLSFATYVGVREDAIATLSEALGAALPEDFGQITIMSEERLTTWQSIARTLDRVALLAVVITVTLIVVALVISGDRRRTLVQLAIGIVVALVITAIVQRNVIEAVDAAIPGPPEQAAADVLFDAVFANLRAVSWVFITVAAVVGITAHIAGRPRWLEALRGRGESGDHNAGLAARGRERIATNRDAFVISGIVVAVGALWAIGLSAASVIVVGLLFGGYLWYVRSVASVRAEAPQGEEPQASSSAG